MLVAVAATALMACSGKGSGTAAPTTTVEQLGEPVAEVGARCDLALVEALPDGVTVTSSRCDMVADTLYFGGTYVVGGESSAFFLADTGAGLQPIAESAACGEGARTLPARVSAYCDGGQPDDGGFPGAPLAGDSHTDADEDGATTSTTASDPGDES